MINKRSIKKLCLAPSTHESAVPGCCRCQGYIQPHILGARAAAALGMHRSSCTSTIPAPGLAMVVSMPELWPLQPRSLLPSMGPTVVPQHKVTAHTATFPCVPQILPGLYLGNFVGKWNPAAAEMFSSWGVGLA